MDRNLASASDLVFAGGEVGYHKAIIIQAAGKAADPSLDAQAMQKGSAMAGSWDAREFAKQVFVPWNMMAGSPFSHAADPYVSNPYRIPRFDASVRNQRQRKSEFDNALVVLETLNQAGDRNKAQANLVEILLALRRFIDGRSVDYPLPHRASLAATLKCADSFVGQRSGGARLQAIVSAVFRSLASRGMRYADLRSRHVNASDASSAASGDVAFRMDRASSAIEVKDKPLARGEFDATVDKCRVVGTTELIIVVRSENLLESSFAWDEFESECDRQFSSGLNIYLADFAKLMSVALTLLGEQGRRDFLRK